MTGGQIVGSALPPSSDYTGYSLNDGHYTPVQPPGSAGGSLASGINASGQVVGTYYAQPGFMSGHGFLLTGGTYTTLDVPGSIFTAANGINDQGQVVGWTNSSGQNQVFLWSPAAANSTAG